MVLVFCIIRLKSIISEAPANYKFLLVCAFDALVLQKNFSGLHNVEVPNFK